MHTYIYIYTHSNFSNLMLSNPTSHALVNMFSKFQLYTCLIFLYLFNYFCNEFILVSK